jgi:cysteine desulfurase
MRHIYLDHNATTQIHPEVVKEMLPFLKETFGNPSSIHWFGQNAHRAIDQARQRVAELIHANPEEIVFTSGGTESNNHALRGVLLAYSNKGNHIITSSIEHQAVLSPCKYLEKCGFKVTYLPVDQYGIIDLEAVKQAITKNTVLISVMFANNEIGTIQPIKELAKIAKENGVILHTDAVQAVGKIPIDVQTLDVDLLSFSAHKFNGPKGIGALYIRQGTKVTPLIFGGHHERGRRAGTENVSGIVGFGKACEIAAKDLKENKIIYIKKLRDKLHQGITSRIEEVFLNGHPEMRLPNTLNMSFAFVEGESMVMNLDLMGIAVSTGSACTSGTLEPSHVLTAIGCGPERAHSSLRFSLGKDNTEEEINIVIDTLEEIITKLRKMSPLYVDFKQKKGINYASI